jgi:hypothetical protein
MLSETSLSILELLLHRISKHVSQKSLALEWLVHKRDLLLKLRPQLSGVFYIATLKRYLHLIVE